MSEAARRKGYRFDRVLLETSRILTPQFDDTVVYLTGAQVEMLRNITQYLGRAETYVSEYAPGYYLTPTVGDLDDILAIVADLEETLMGNPNTIWGYTATYLETKSDLNATVDVSSLVFTEVPPGEVWKVLQWAAVDVQTQCTSYILEILRAAAGYALDVWLPAAANDYLGGPVDLTLEEGDALRITFVGTVAGDDVYGWVNGYKMVVP